MVMIAVRRDGVIAVHGDAVTYAAYTRRSSSFRRGCLCDTLPPCPGAPISRSSTWRNASSKPAFGQKGFPWLGAYNR